jgi:hypothetical protein
MHGPSGISIRALLAARLLTYAYRARGLIERRHVRA